METKVRRRYRDETKRLMPPRTWGEIKVAIAGLGVKDVDRVYLIDIGCIRAKIVADRDDVGVEITDHGG